MSGELKAGREFDVLIARRVMGWKAEVHHQFTPSVTIAIAIQVVETLTKDGHFTLRYDGEYYYATFVVGPKWREYDGQAKTAPLAICRAARKATA